MSRILATLALFAAANTATASIIATFGAAEEIAPPTSVIFGDLESDTSIFAFGEQIVTLEENLEVDVSVAFRSTPVIPEGTEICSYHVSLDSINGAAVTLSGGLEFATPVIGLITSTGLLAASDGILGNPGTAYPGDFPARGLEGTDVATIDGPNTVSFEFGVTEPGDHIRVICLIPEPTSAVSLVLLGLVSVLRRR